MSNEVCLNVIGPNNTTRKATILTEDKSFINSIITVGENNTIKDSDFTLLQSVAKKSGNPDVIENSDLNGEQMKNLALANGFGEYYDITVSKDGKYLQVKIKDAGLFCKNPNLADIKADFGVRNNVFVQKGNIPHGNEGVIPRSTGGAGFDSVIIPVGKTINIPLTEINIDGSPRGAFGRILSFLAN